MCRQGCKALKHCSVFLYLREGVAILLVEMVEGLDNPTLLHLVERLMKADRELQEKLLVFLKLVITCTPLDRPQNPSC